jgi:hypothetical protein
MHIIYNSDIAHTNMAVGIIFINKIDKFSHSKLGRFEAGDFL